MDEKVKLLLIEDECMLAEILADTLSGRGFCVDVAHDGEQGMSMALANDYDVMIVDVMMPKMDGFSLVKSLREKGFVVPVLFLTARSATEDVVRGFGVGGNDFLRKPFALDELIVRVKALTGRLSCHAVEECVYSIGKYIFDARENTLAINGVECVLAAREAAVLLLLCRKMGHTVEASGILRELWGDDTYFNLRSLNVYISRLRHRLELDDCVKIISVRGVGYVLRVK